MTTKTSGAVWWRAFGWRPGRRRHGNGNVDFADMGTEFALEATLAASNEGQPVEHRATLGDSADARQRSAIERLNGRSVR